MVLVLEAALGRVNRYYDRDVRRLAAEVAFRAVDSARVEEIDFIVIGSSISYLQSPQLDLASYIASYLGLRGVKALTVEAGEASGLAAVQVAKSLIDSNNAEKVLVIGVDKLTDHVSSETYRHIQSIYDTESDAIYNIGHAGMAGLLMRLYMRRYGLSREDMAYWPVAMHSNGKNNPYAMLRFNVSIDKVVNAMPIADPVTLLDLYPIGDGASAVLLSSPRNSYASDAIAELVRVESTTGYPSPALRDDPLQIESLVEASRRLSMSSREWERVDVIEMHDTSTIMAYMVIETLGLADKGKAPIEVERGRFTIDGGGPVINPSGGLKSRGHPIGATGVYQLAEVSLQLSNRFPGVKVDDARVGAVINVNGHGSSSYIGLLRAV